MLGIVYRNPREVQGELGISAEVHTATTYPESSDFSGVLVL